MEEAERSAGTINGSSGDEESSAPPMSKKEAKEAAKAAAKQEEKMAQKALKKKAKQMGITVEELEAMEAEGDGDDEDEFGVDATPEAVNGAVRLLNVCCLTNHSHVPTKHFSSGIGRRVNRTIHTRTTKNHRRRTHPQRTPPTSYPNHGIFSTRLHSSPSGKHCPYLP